MQVIFTSAGLQMNPRTNGAVAALFVFRQAGFFLLAMVRVGFWAALLVWEERRGPGYSVIGSASGGLVAAVMLTAIPEALRALGESNVRLIVYGTMVLFVLWFLPNGLGGVLNRIMRRASASPPLSTGPSGAPRASEAPWRQ